MTILPCPFCGNEPWFEGDAADWEDDARYVQLELRCCTTMTETIGWQQARRMTVEARTIELKNKLASQWNRRTP
jgi:hypothetical protein